MPLSTINNGDSGSTARAAINAVIAEVNLLGSAAYQNTTAFDAAGDAAAAMNALLAGNNSWGDLQTFARISFAGNISAGAWLTGGLRTVGVAGTLTDTTSSGTVSSACTHKIAGDTIAASSATTFTDYFGVYMAAPWAGTNVTLTSAWALGADSLYVGTSNPFKVAANGAVTAQNLVTATNAGNSFLALYGDTKDGVALAGRNGGSSSYIATITTAALTASRTFTIPAVSADDTFALLGVANVFTGANTFTNAAGIVTRQAATQDGITLLGRAGGTSSYSASITTAALTASRTFTIPAVSANDTFALLGIAQTFTAAQTVTPSGGTSANAATFNGRVVINGDAVQDLRLGSSGMFITNVGGNRIGILDSSTAAAYTFWSDSRLILSKDTGNIGWRNGATTLYSDASNQIDMRNSTSAQTINVYRTYTDASNYERMALKSASGYFEVACETAGTGTDDLDLRLTPAGTGLVNLPGGTLLKTRTALTDGAGVNTGTLLNSPASGNPTKWVPINDNGTTRYIPMW